ncbi:MAG: hypothetical protein JSV88_19855 [Candidatus Aminicenantes bacterium]|nr:MAG: hypothetical protein JSV88_19855 [Candidatus Aminicenantes bacterium]
MQMDAKRENLLVLEHGHLSDEASTLMVEALQQGKITDAPQEVLTHVEACRECKDKIMEVVTFLRNPDSAGELRRKITKKTKARQDWYFYRGKIAAVFVVFALLAAAYFFIYKNPSFLNRFLADPAANKQDQEVLSKTTTPTPNINTHEKKAAVDRDMKDVNEIKANVGKRKNGQSLASRYRVNPNLENMIGSRLRSGSFEVLAPGNGSVIEEPIHFSWKKTLTETHTLKIVSNKNQVLYTYSVQGDSFDFREKLPMGLYYWKLESKNELLYVGKFFIGNPPRSSPPR